ncbi:hypothetical protein ACS0X5_11725 [Burkholderia gladioli]|uniref:hypothetical protein n=1 Tax=Burkholderia TaxID=32008 RepID=UPI0020369886|nr:hypothetical protein [Burkholderia glumae]MCM2480647.1 hypothetical protein [Burkholderia glumae]MCM2509214.1 hypothetical protein [Burkholderia glumae]
MSDDDDHGSQGSLQLQIIPLISEPGSQLYPTLNECIGDVLEKDEAEHDGLVLWGVAILHAATRGPKRPVLTGSFGYAVMVQAPVSPSMDQ